MAGSASQSQSHPLSAEEEALKRNTDCVYFLASPLTCKKGSECDYRHSEVARVNPRDCYYWLHGNCLNPKCGFRHPPLEGLLGAQVPTPTGPSAPVSQTISAPAAYVPNVSNKPGVPCIFFQKGYCLKGDWCPFLHVPNNLSNKPPATPVTVPPPAEPPTNIKALSGLIKSVQEKKVPPVSVAKSVKDSAGGKLTFQVGPTLPRNESIISRRTPQTTPASNGNQVNWPIRIQQYRDLDEPELEPEKMNIKDKDEVSREPSPGFDVLVDDDVRDSDYYPGEDRYGMSREHEARNEHDMCLSNDYNSITAVDDEGYQGRPIGYDSHEHRKGQYGGYEQNRGGSSERRSGGSYFERRPYARPDNVGQVDEIDLRHRLAKHKKPNGLRSVISHENTCNVQAGDRSYRGSGSESQRSSSRENPLSRRLRGRISLPRRSLSPNNRDMIRGGRLSPVSANMALHQGRIRDNVRGRDIRRRVDEGFKNGEKNYNRGPYLRRDTLGEDKFPGPKSLAELKNRKNDEAPSSNILTDRQSLGKRKHMMHQESGNELSFEGPKPLEEILKRKRGETNWNSSNNDEGILKDKIQEEGKYVTYNEKSVTPIGKNDEVYNSTSIQESEVGPVDSKQEGENGMLDQELETYEERDGESDYERVRGEDYDLYDGENGDNVEYADEDDDDDFAKKMGVMYS